MKRIYIDESGNTGIIKEEVKGEYKFNFCEQPYFSLGGIMIDDSDKESIKQKLKDLYYKDQIEGELKYKSYKNRVKLLDNIIEVFNSYECTMFFDVTNKRYKIINYIVDYCVIPYYSGNRLEDSEESKYILNIVSDILYQELSDEVLYKFIEMINRENNSVDKLIEFCKLLLISIKSKFIKEQIKETIDTIENYENFGLSIKNLFPLIDHTNIGEQPFSLLPNVDALNNVIVQLSKNEISNVEIVHDMQKEYSNSLAKWVDFIAKNKMIQVRTTFKDSKEDVILQAVDFITGHVNKFFKIKNIDKNKYIENIIKNNVNFVSTYEEQKIINKFPMVEEVAYNMLYEEINKYDNPLA